MNSLLIVSLFLAFSIIACGTEYKESPTPALCKTLKDGSVERYEIAESETGTREVMVSMGFVECQ